MGRFGYEYKTSIQERIGEPRSQRRSRESNKLVAYGGIVVRDLFRPGAPGDGRHLSWEHCSRGGEFPEVSWPVQLVLELLPTGRKRSTKDGFEAMTSTVRQPEREQRKI
jgi:hypothetical protein